MDVPNSNNPFSLKINGKELKIYLSPPDKHFNDMNLLGTDYMFTFGARLIIDYAKEENAVVLIHPTDLS